MFNKNVEVTIVTRFKNEDNFKITRLADTYKQSGTTVEVYGVNDEVVEVRFTTLKSCVKSLKENLKLLTFVGIEGKMEIK